MNLPEQRLDLLNLSDQPLVVWRLLATLTLLMTWSFNGEAACNTAVSNYSGGGTTFTASCYMDGSSPGLRFNNVGEVEPIFANPASLDNEPAETIDLGSWDDYHHEGGLSSEPICEQATIYDNNTFRISAVADKWYCLSVITGGGEVFSIKAQLNNDASGWATGSAWTTASSPEPEMDLSVSMTAIADGGSHDFGSQSLNTNADVVFTITNSGDGDLTLTTPITIGGTDADQFSIQAQPGSPVSSGGGTTTFTVRFTPTSLGAKTATIAIANDDSDENPYDLTLNGTGIDTTNPTVTVEQAGGQSDPATNGPVNFTATFNEPVSGFATGDVTLGGTSNATTGTVTEIAPNDGTTYNIAVSGMTLPGTVTASIAGAVATDAAGNGNDASTSMDNSVTLSNPAIETDPGALGRSSSSAVPLFGPWAVWILGGLLAALGGWRLRRAEA